ncbi:MAG: BrnA antitoxin family protein [Pyrinomonadaceae bacterium]
MNQKNKEMVYVQTEEEYQKGLAKGWTDEDMLKPGTYKVRRSPWAEKLRKAKKVKVSIYLDGDVVEHFRLRSEEPNAAPYQTQINNELRKVMEDGSSETATVERDILNDKKFLKALKKKLETV